MCLGEAMLFEILQRRRIHLTALLFLRAVMLCIFNVVLCLTINYFVNRFVLL